MGLAAAALLAGAWLGLRAATSFVAPPAGPRQGEEGDGLFRVFDGRAERGLPRHATGGFREHQGLLVADRQFLVHPCVLYGRRAHRARALLPRPLLVVSGGER